MSIAIESKFFEENHLKNTTDVQFSETKNLIIGPNGSGKTRFLNTVRNYYETKMGYQDYEIVFADFPHLIYEENETEHT